MKIVITSLMLSLLGTGMALAQNQQTADVVPSTREGLAGTITAQGGLGSASPWGALLDMQYQHGKLTLRPYVGITGISRHSSARLEDTDYSYISSGNIYWPTGTRERSSILREREGNLLQYGTVMSLRLNPANTLTADVKVRRTDTEGFGSSSLSLYVPTPFSASYHAVGTYHAPEQLLNELQASLGWQGRLNEHHSLSLRYDYARMHDENESEETYTSADAGVSTVNYSDICNEADVVKNTHTANGEWLYTPSKTWSLRTGITYNDRKIESEDFQSANPKRMGVTGDFEHQMRNWDYYTQLALTLPYLTLQARLTYEHTQLSYTYRQRTDEAGSSKPSEEEKQNDQKLDDLIPQVSLTLPMGKRDQLVAAYVRRINRPDIDRLNPMQRLTYFGVEYGNADLKGVHINQATLTYRHVLNRGNFNTTVAYVRVKDGFNGLWLLQGDHRVNSWGNEGERKAWSVAPAIQYSPLPLLTLKGKATLLWDKRMAPAIDREKENWGITTEGAAELGIPKFMTVDVHGLYSEGNMLDLYSSESRSYQIGTRMDIPLGLRTRLQLSYDYREYPKVLITQVFYTGSAFRRPDARHEAMAKLIVNF